MGGQRSCNVDKLLKQEVMGGQSLHVIEKLPKLEMSGFQKSHNLDKPLKQEVIGGQRSRNVEKVLKQEMMGGQKPCDLNKPPKQDVIRGQRSHNLQEMLKQEMMGGQRSRNVEKVLKPEVIGDQKPCDLNKPPKQDVIRGQRSHNLQEMLKQEMMGGQRTHNMKKLLKQEGMGGQRSCGVEKLVKQEVMRGQRSCDVEKLLKQSQAELQWIQRQLSILSKRSLDHQLPTDRHGALHHSPDGAQLYGGAWGRGRGLLLQQQLDILLPRQVEESRITPQPVRDGAATVKSEYDKIRKKFAIVTWERDSALQKNRELEDKLEKLEQVLKHMRDTAEQRYQLELDHEQALAILHKRQQEIDLLQKAQVQAKKEHEGTVHLLEDKVQELEQKCRSQSEQFSLLWKELEKFRLQAVVIDTAPAEAIRELDVHGPKDKLYSWLLSGLQPQTEKSDQSSVKFSVKSKLHLVDGNKTHLLSVKTSPPNTSRSSCLQRDSQSEMDEMESRTSRSKDRYTGKVRLCTARYSYNPYDGPNEHPEAELPLVAGSYLYVYGTMDDDGFYQGELLDGQRGLVPSNFVELVQDKADRSSVTTWGEEAPGWKPSAEGGENTAEALGVVKDEFGDEVVPYPRGITLIKQLAKSVIVGWDSALVPPGWGTLSAYDVLVGTEVRCRVLAGGRNKLLVEKLDLAAHTYRISVRSVTDKGSSDELRCTLLVGQGAVVAPCCLRVAGVSRDSADLAWMPSNSNYSHTVFLNGTEHREVGPACYQCRLRDLSPMTVYRVRIAARPHQVPWQLPLEQREKAEVSAEFCTQAAGPPFPPQEVQVQSGQFPGVLQVRWRTPELTTTGTSNGASVIGYAVCTKGQRIAEVLYPTADYMVVELNRIQTLEAGEIFVRTLSLQGESQDSAAATIPYHLLVPPHPPPQPQAHPLPPSEPRLQPAPRPESGAPETKEEEVRKVSNQDWGPPYSRSPLSPPLMSGHSLGAPPHLLGRSPSPQRILPQPRGAPIPDNVAKAMARQAAQRVAADSRMSHAVHQQNSDEEEEESVDGGDPVHSRRRGVSVDEFLRGSELGRQLHSSYSEEAQTDSSRGSDLSDIMEEEEEEDLRSEMQTEEGRRRSGVSHNTLKILGSPPTTGPLYRGSGRRPVYSISPVSVPAIEITTESNSDENQWTIKEAVYDDGVARTRIWPKPQGPASARRCDSNPVRHAPPCEAVSEPGDSWRIFVALFDYDPHTMSPNPNAVNEELCFKEGQIIKVYGDKDTDGFYRAELSDKMGLIPCNMVSEIQAEDGDVMDKLIKQGFLPLNTPVDKLERDSRSGEPLGFTRRMVALYDYDPRESSPNVDVEAELTFSAGDVITILRAIDEDGFYYGEMNGHRGLIPSNFLEEVPDDVEVYLTDTPRHAVSEATTVTPEEMVPAQRAASPSTPSTQPDCELARSVESPHDLSSKRKKGLLSKGKRLLKRLAVVK